MGMYARIIHRFFVNNPGWADIIIELRQGDTDIEDARNLGLVFKVVATATTMRSPDSPQAATGSEAKETQRIGLPGFPAPAPRPGTGTG